MKKDIHIIIISMSIYVVNRLTKDYNNIPYIGYLCKCYLNDFLGGVVFIAYVNVLLAKFNYPKIQRGLHMGLLMLLCGIFWEYVCPLFLSYSVSDFYDVIAYILGGMMYYVFMSKAK